MTADIESFDAIVIGAGQAGNPMANTLASKGLKTALVEKNYVGGTCVNTGCTPTKAMIASAHAAHTSRHSSDLGITAEQVKVDFQKVINRKDQIVKMFRGGSEKSIKGQENLELIEGAASFTNQKTILIKLHDGSTRTLHAEKIFINVGAQTSIPAIPGINEIPYLDNSTIMQLSEIPEHLLIIGGGYIGLEFGQMFHRFGSKVSILQHGNHLVAHEDEDASEELADILKDEGINLYFNSELTAIRQKDDEIFVEGRLEGKNQEISGTHVLIATGREPNTALLDLGKAGIATDEKGYIKVDKYLKTNVDGVYALGDVKGGPQFTHVSYHDYTIVKKNLFEGGNLTTDDRILTYTVFTVPQLGRAGLNEKQAKEQGISYKVAKIPMESVARGIETGQTKGFMKALVDNQTDKIIGATILGPEGGEVASALLIAMMGGLTYQQVRDGMFPHPTFCESLNNLFMSL